MTKLFYAALILTVINIGQAKAELLPNQVRGDFLYNTENGKIEIINVDDLKIKSLIGIKKVFVFTDIKIDDSLKNKGLSYDSIQSDTVSKFSTYGIELATNEDLAKDQSIPRLKITLSLYKNNNSLFGFFLFDLYQQVHPVTNPNISILAKTISYWNTVNSTTGYDADDAFMIRSARDFLNHQLDEFIANLKAAQNIKQEPDEKPLSRTLKKQRK